MLCHPHADIDAVAVVGQVTLSSLNDRALIVKDGKAFTTIDGKEDCQLITVYVMLGSSWGMPTVKYIEIFGKDTDGADVYEKKMN